MTMQMFLIRDGEKRKLTTPYPDADHAVVEGACPECKSTDFKIAGHGRRPSSDDRAWEADATALCCHKPVGLIRVEPDTLFGVREDEAVLQGRCRVY